MTPRSTADWPRLPRRVPWRLSRLVWLPDRKAAALQEATSNYGARAMKRIRSTSGDRGSSRSVRTRLFGSHPISPPRRTFIVRYFHTSGFCCGCELKSCSSRSQFHDLASLRVSPVGPK